MKRVLVVVGIIERQGRILICRRKKENAALGGYWEFPGGKVETGETLTQALIREMQEELGLAVKPGDALSVIEHQYPAVHVTLHPYLCTVDDGEPRALAADEVRWIDPTTLTEYQFPPANVTMLEEVVARYPRSAG
jgi:mutator protein MutT